MEILNSMWKLVILLLCNLYLEVYSNEDEVIDLSRFGERLFGQPVLSRARNLQRSTDNPEEQGPYIEGDILVPLPDNNTRNGMKTESLRWRSGVVPFEIRGSFSNSLILCSNIQVNIINSRCL